MKIKTCSRKKPCFKTPVDIHFPLPRGTISAIRRANELRTEVIDTVKEVWTLASQEDQSKVGAEILPLISERTDARFLYELTLNVTHPRKNVSRH